MRKIIVAVLFAVAFAVSFAFGRARAETPVPAQNSRCAQLAPICPIGQHPLCTCENEWSINCWWICVG